MTTLRQGDRSPVVRELQLLLAMTGHDPGPIDGVYGPRTRAGVCSWKIYGDGTAVDGVDIDLLRVWDRRAVEVPRVLTPASAVDVRIALVAGYAATFDEIDERNAAVAGFDYRPREPNPNSIRVALAQLCVEHGAEPWGGEQTRKLARASLLPSVYLWPKQGEPSYIAIWTNNIGNRQVTRDDYRSDPPGTRPIPTVPYSLLRAREGVGASAKMLTSACYAYPNLAEGAGAYWRFLRDHCGPSLTAFERGDPAGAAHELKVGRWHYSGDEAAYARAMVDRFKAIP